jgi:hypothetical protein
MGSPVAPSLSEATTCLTYLKYLFTVSAARFAFFILSTRGLTVMLFTFVKDRSPMMGRIHLFSAPSTLTKSLIRFRSRLPAQRRYSLV